MFGKRQLLAMFVVAAAAFYLGFANRPAQKVSGTSSGSADLSSKENGQSSIGTVARQLHVAKTSSVVPIATQDAKSAYRAFKKGKVCFSLKDQTASDLLEEISALRESIHQVSADLVDEVRRQIANDEELLQQKKDCSEEKSLTANDLRDLLATAARMGNIDAQLEYAQHPMFDPFHAIANLDSMREWRNSAPKYVYDLANRGNPQAILILAEGMDPFQCHAANQTNCGGQLGDVLPDNAAQSYRYYRLLQFAVGSAAPSWVAREMSALETLMSSDEIAKANREAQDSYQDLPQATRSP